MPRWGRSWPERILDLCLPLACAGCREDLPPPLSGPLCGACLGALSPCAAPLCGRCGAPLAGRGGCRRLCGRDMPSLDWVRAAFLYGGPIPPLLHDFKYERSLRAGRALAGWMAGAAGRHPLLAQADALVPVPLHPRRLRWRGFNQASVLAEAVGSALKTPVLHALERSRATRPQVSFGREDRRLRLLDAFLATRRLPRGARVVLIDDVCTSGGTLEGCARALRRGGARRVGAYVLARG